MKVNAAAMRESADRAAEFLKSLGNRHRLLILCQLLDAERSVTDLSQFLEIRDSTVSQHLALLRREGLVKARRDGQTIWYSLNSEPAREVLAALYRCFCAVPETAECSGIAPTVTKVSSTRTAGRSRRIMQRIASR
ncbi:MAG TPA: metalloregulator ArsR/SmtB family transcription factor [Acetobacteraceae bacterium]|jgi:DNA-binding transcriptional ArsR family regulator|nr:metalloregulator ArsR/SmtB family transcription factor [Acetobacteraceae bacterium]